MADPVLLERVRADLAAVFGTDVRIVRTTVLSQGERHAVLAVVLDRAPGRLVVKLADPAAAPAVDLARTAAVSGLAVAAGVPVPTVLGVSVGRGDGRWDCLVSAWAPGLPWQSVHRTLDRAETAAVHGQMLAVLGALQTVRLPGFGELDSDGEPDGSALLEALARRGELRIADLRRRALFSDVLRREAASFPERDGATLVHDDLHSANLLVQPRGDRAGARVTAVLDWDKAWAGPSDSDPARLSFWDEMPDVPVADKRSVRRRLVHQLLWCLEREDPSARHATDTAGLCRQLGVAPPAA